MAPDFRTILARSTPRPWEILWGRAGGAVIQHVGEGKGPESAELVAQVYVSGLMLQGGEVDAKMEANAWYLVMAVNGFERMLAILDNDALFPFDKLKALIQLREDVTRGQR